MPVEVTARHMEATDSLQSYAREKGQAICDEFPRVEHVHLILDVQKHLQIAEVVVQAKNRIRTEAKESSDSMRASIDQAVDKISRQLRKLRDKVQDHKAAMRHVEQDRAKG
ncbi:MAG: ribosome-associated translation inhibitor RaiA [Verrucomicrobia bacterium]|nr:ribosome-associated translation inhibitor RaiA [Verrucomicrobiota bacterium]